jgi:hypothetical protein
MILQSLITKLGLSKSMPVSKGATNLEEKVTENIKGKLDQDVGTKISEKANQTIHAEPAVQKDASKDTLPDRVIIKVLPQIVIEDTSKNVLN